MNKTTLCVGLLFLLWTAVPAAGAEEIRQPITINEAVHTALANNLNLRLQQEEAARTLGTAQAEEGTFDPSLAAEAMNQKQDTTPVALGSSQQETNTQWNARLSKRLTTGTELDLSWQNRRLETDSLFYPISPIYNSGLNFGIRQPLLQGLGSEVQTAGLEAARRQAEAAAFQVDSRAADLAAEVKNAYWELVFAWQDIEVRKLALTLAEKLRDETKEMIEVGMLAAVEIYEPESEVALRERQLIGGEWAIGVAEDELKLLLNTEDWNSGLDPQDRPRMIITEPAFDQVLANAMANRPDIKAADLQVEAARLRVAAAKNRVLPSLDLEGGVGIGGTSDSYRNSLDNISRDPDTVWRVGIVFSTPLGNNTAKGEYHQAKASLAKARTEAEFLRQQIRRGTREVVRDVELAIKGVEAAKKTSLATLKRLEAEQEKFEVGRSTANDVLEAQEAYAEAVSSENRVRIEYAKTLAELDRIQGIIRLAGNVSTP
jgi:outer membrane protein TolC